MIHPIHQFRQESQLFHLQIGFNPDMYLCILLEKKELEAWLGQLLGIKGEQLGAGVEIGLF
jgi:hypothetical protein